MPILFRTAKTVDGRRIMKSLNALHTKLTDLDSKLEELDESISELVALIQRKKTISLLSEYFDVKEGRVPAVLIATKGLDTSLKEKLNRLYKKYNFSLIIEKAVKEDNFHLQPLLSYIYKTHNKGPFLIAVLKTMDPSMFIESTPDIVLSYPYPTKNAKFQSEKILGLLTILKQNIYALKNDLFGFDAFLYYTLKYFNKKNVDTVVPLIIGISKKISMDKLEIIIKHIITEWGANNV